MPREMKFRAWNTEHVPSAFDYFNLVDLNNGNMMGMKSIEEMPVMQYTGLKDKSGKEIYEGDILNEGSEVFFYELYAYFCYPQKTENSLKYMLLSADTNMEIIGNIYETPELLKQRRIQETANV